MRVLIAEGQASTRSALKLLLQEEPGLEVVGEAAAYEELLAEARATHPDVVLLAWDLPGPTLMDLLPTLRSLNSRLSVIVLSGRPELEPEVGAAGADAFVSMCDPPKCLLMTFQAIQAARSEERPDRQDAG